jgi:hypothetical protein
MALNDLNTERQYTRYKRHVNDSGERVDATQVNQIQEDINKSQKDINTVKDTAFEERVYTIFNNNLYVNAMFLDAYKDGRYIDMTLSSNVALRTDEGRIQLEGGKETGTVTSTKIQSVHGDSIELNDFFLITNEFVPVGASIKYYLTTSSGEKYPVTPNALKLPLHLFENIKYGFTITAELKANAMGEVPYINGYAVLYWDAQVEYNYGLTNPDLQRFP